MARDKVYFLKISGEVSARNQREFEQTIQFVFNHLSSYCLSHSLTVDVHIPNLYHLYSTWNSEESLYTFRSSENFELIKGAFQTLGSHKETVTGQAADIQLFELNR